MARTYRRRLPHVDVRGRAVFVTWRLHGSIPEERRFPLDTLTSGQAFAAYDRLLDEVRSGVSYMRRPEIADVVAAELKGADAEVHAWVVMPNHVHVLWTPRISNGQAVKRVKGVTALRANKLLGLTGKPFWQDEFFDRIAREDEFGRISRYIEWNPVRAGLVAQPEDYRWSSAGERD
jgi:REP element-mobilizing transposase RayT